MSRATIDFGIDLGTTNSAIAVLEGVATEIIKPNGTNADITPSAVSIDKNGTVRVGERAKGRLSTDPKNAWGEFKRGMGTDRVYKFKSSGFSKRPEELSAEVLKSLCLDVQQRRGELVEACVITVPAAFELHQCNATRAAAQLAGLKQSPLLQEPVAAALSYGFQVDRNKAYWLVYDFGGGTFDAAVIKSADGIIQVVNHGGDNFLGGSDIDWAIVNHVLVPRLLLEHKLPDFVRGNARWLEAFARLKCAVEDAKIELSRSESTTLEDCQLDGTDGEKIDVDYEVTRADVIRVAEPFIQRSVGICQRVLKEKNLGKAAIEKVLLVGGPTLAPYFRELLSDGLGIGLEHSVDPLTVVARGAAIFAGTQRLTCRDRSPPASSGHYSIDLIYQPVGVDSAPTVGGKISGPAAQDFSGYTLELMNDKTKWSSGKTPIQKDGVFVATLHADRGERNAFSIVLLDPRGRKQKTSPDVLTYTIGATVGEQTLINSMGIALADNKYDMLLEKGRGLPVKSSTGVYRTVRPIRRGQSEDVCKIVVVEGEHKLADRNRRVGSLEIRGEKVSRDLPVGSEVEVTLQIDESRIITVKAYVPILENEDFTTKLELKVHTRDLGFLQSDFDAEVARIREVKAKAALAGGKTAESLVHSAEQSPLMQEVKELLAGGGDPDKCESRLLELKIKLDEAVDALEWPALVSEAREWLGALKAVAKEHADSDQHKRAAELTQELQTLMRKQGPDDLRSKIGEVTALWWEIASAQLAYWVYQRQELEKQVGVMSDQPRATRLLDQGRAFISHGNAAGLQNVVRELWRLLPEDAVEETRRGYQAGIVKVAGS